ncbi:MAG: hypothetical protein GY852_04800, partial [bacterium]|nr:hypothetical protein [bacterium]
MADGEETSPSALTIGSLVNICTNNTTVTGLVGTLARKLGYLDSLQQIESIFHVLGLPLEEIRATEGIGQESPAGNSTQNSKVDYSSTINNDGVPLQIVISSSKERSGLGFLTETADMNHRQSLRVETAGIRLDRIFKSSGIGLHNVASKFKRISSILLPESVEEIDLLRRGSCWVALRFLQSGKFYSSV